MQLTFAVVIVVLLVGTASGCREFNPIPLRAGSEVSCNAVNNCDSWRQSVEVNNLQNWTMVPANCIDYVREYMTKYDITETGHHKDLNVVVEEALDYMQALPPLPTNDTWVFDVIDTLISDLEYYNRSDVQFGGTPFNEAKYNAWLKDPASHLPKVMYMDQMFYAARFKGFKIVLLSGNTVDFKDTLTTKLDQAGYQGWDQLILKPNSSIPTREFKKSIYQELLKNGSTVIGNAGDQWSDFPNGNNVGKRIFKVPNPMYYVQ